MELAVPKMDQRSQISFVLGSNIIKIIKNDRVHRFCAHEGENIPSTPHLLKWFLLYTIVDKSVTERMNKRHLTFFLRSDARFAGGNDHANEQQNQPRV